MVPRDVAEDGQARIELLCRDRTPATRRQPRRSGATDAIVLQMSDAGISRTAVSTWVSRYVWCRLAPESAAAIVADPVQMT